MAQRGNLFPTQHSMPHNHGLVEITPELRAELFFDYRFLVTINYSSRFENFQIVEMFFQFIFS